MTTSTNSWAWYPGATWPGFGVLSGLNPDVINQGGNGLVIDPKSVVDITFNDKNSDGVISDSDLDDMSGSHGDTITVAGATKTVKEVESFQNSTLTVDGVTYTVDMAVWLFEDGTYMVRINDSDIPPSHFKKTTEVKLGTVKDGEYSGSYINTRQKSFVCFAAGTRISTPAGTRPVEALRPNDLVLTLDHGPQPVRWIAARRVAGTGDMAPVVFEPGAIGNLRKLRVSPQHKMLVDGSWAELLFGAGQVLVAARHLINGHSVRQEAVAQVTYVHFLCDRHEIVFAEGAPCESFQPGAMGVGLLSPQERHALGHALPAVAIQPARLCLSRQEG
ncbi:MAG: Hint domain-containing protein, partial [Paracoccaceae bacterium]|nr:Hint domain-containing protein [Paracoccaceae bacterium]